MTLDYIAGRRYFNFLGNLVLVVNKFNTVNSFSDISGNTILSDIPTLMIGVLVMIIYILFAISNLNCIDAKVSNIYILF